jgi:hypothetical protein
VFFSFFLQVEVARTYLARTRIEEDISLNALWSAYVVNSGAPGPLLCHPHLVDRSWPFHLSPSPIRPPQFSPRLNIPLWLYSDVEKSPRTTLLTLQSPRRIRVAGGDLPVRTDPTSSAPAVSYGFANWVADTAFKQQRLKAWQPILTPKTVLPTLFIIGILFAPIGALLIWGNSKVCCSFLVIRPS